MVADAMPHFSPVSCTLLNVSAWIFFGTTDSISLKKNEFFLHLCLIEQDRAARNDQMFHNMSQYACLLYIIKWLLVIEIF